MALAQWFREGGVWMYPILLFAVTLGPVDLLALILAIVGRIVGSWALIVARVVAALCLVAAAVPAVVGVVGWAVGMNAVDAALVHVPPDQADLIREVGYAEARVPLFFGGGVSGVVGLMALTAAVIAFAPVRRADEEPLSG